MPISCGGAAEVRRRRTEFAHGRLYSAGCPGHAMRAYMRRPLLHHTCGARSLKEYSLLIALVCMVVETSKLRILHSLLHNQSSFFLFGNNEFQVPFW